MAHDRQAVPGQPSIEGHAVGESIVGRERRLAAIGPTNVLRIDEVDDALRLGWVSHDDTSITQ